MEHLTLVVDEQENRIYDDLGRVLMHNNANGELCYVEHNIEAPTPLRSKSTAPSSTQEFTDKANKLLLDIYYTKLADFRDSTKKKCKLWIEVTAALNAHGYEYAPQILERKFRNLKAHYLKIKDNNTKTGRGRITWPYFHILDKIFATDGCVNPSTCVSAMPSTSSAGHNVSCSGSSGLCSPADNRSATTSLQLTSSVRDLGSLCSQSSGTSGYEFIRHMHPDTEMLPENATIHDVQAATLQRRLTPKKRLNNETHDNPHVKRVRKSEPEWVKTVTTIQNQHMAEIKELITRHNDIQTARNQLLADLLKKI